MGLHIVPPDSSEYFVYAMLCQDGDGPLYVKFGRSRNITKRLSQLRTSCPIPAKFFAVVQVVTESQQGHLERGLHAQFKKRRTTGEWFKFDSNSKDDKRAFNDGCLIQFVACLGSGYKWEKISIKALNRYNKERRRIYYKNKKFIDALHFAELNKKSAWKELDSYGKKAS